MRRSILLAVGVCVLLWAAAARTDTVPPDTTVAPSEVELCLVAGDPHEPSDTDLEWRAQHHTIAAVTESVWKSALVHADLAAAPSASVFAIGRSVSSPDPPARSAPPYLRHTPLLI